MCNSVVLAVEPGTLIENTATIAFTTGSVVTNQNSNTVSIITEVVRTPAVVQFYQYTSAAGTLSEQTPSSCRNGASGPFNPSANPTVTTAGGSTTLDPNTNLPLSPTQQYHVGDPVFIRLADMDQNLLFTVAETVMVRVTSSVGDQEDVQLTETDVNTGVFIGYIQSVANGSITNFNCLLTVTDDSSVTVNYTDIADGTDTATASTLVDPYGVVFDSVTGVLVDGAVITLIDVATGLPAIPGVQLFGDDGVNSFPSTIVSGASATDGGGTVLIFPTGGYRFPLVAPGNYRLQVTPPVGYSAPSIVMIPVLQTLPTAPFSLDANGSYGNNFALNPGPPLHIDIPLDPATATLIIDKTVSQRDAGIGDFVQYTVRLENADPLVPSTNLIITDILPIGFRYQSGSAKINNVLIVDPLVSSDGRTLQFAAGNLAGGTSLILSYVTQVGAGAVLGKAINRVQAQNQFGTQSNEGLAVINIRDDLMRETAFIVGRVLVDSCPVETDDSGKAYLRIEGARHVDSIEYSVDVSVVDVAVLNTRLTVELPAALDYQPGLSTSDGKKIDDPIIEKEGRRLVFTLNNVSAARQWKQQIRFNTKIAKEYFGRAQTFVTASLDTSYQKDQLTPTASSTIILDKNREAGSSQNLETRTVAVGESGSGFANTADSGLVSAFILAYRENYEQKSIGTELTGIPKARVFMENGAYVVTDENGKYHFEGIKPGAHVVQLDTDSIPDNMEVYHCEENVRFAGKSYSQFVDVKGGTLWRADFHVRPKPPVRSEVSLQLFSELANDEVAMRLELKGGPIAVNNYRVTVMLPEGMAYKPMSSALDQKAIAEPDVKEGYVVYRLGDFASDWNKVLTLKGRLSNQASGQMNIKAVALLDTVFQKNVRIAPVENIVFKELSKYLLEEKLVYRRKYETLGADLDVQDVDSINKIIDKLVSFQVERIRVVGHTDNVPIAKHNLYLYEDNVALSKARANSIADYLTAGLNIDDTQIETVPMGESQPADKNTTDSGRAENRRTDLIVDTLQVLEKGRVEIIKEISGMSKVIIEGPQAATEDQSMPELPAVPQHHIDAFGNKWLNTAEPGVEWLFPADNFIPSIPVINVAIKHHPAHRIEPRLNGELINPLMNFGVEKNDQGSIARTYWQGIQLRDGRNELDFVVRDAADNEVKRFKKSIHYSGSPVRAEIVAEYSRLVADGVTTPIVAVRFYDQADQLVRPGTAGTFKVSQPYLAKEFTDAAQKESLVALDRLLPQYKVEDHGIALIELQETTQTGQVKLDFFFGVKQQQSVTAWLQPDFRNWIVVGLADATLGSQTLTGNAANALSVGFENGEYDENRVALFAKGQINNNWLFTGAYDSEKKTDAYGSNGLFQTIDPDQFFSLYGDKTEQYYEAASTDKLFAKIERQQFYAMYGDYNTGLTDTELTNYGRAVNGLKTEHDGDRFNLNFFATETSQRFAKDEIQGDGTSGLYRLSQANIVINSERITIETRDRFHSQNVIESTAMRRHLDYDIDYQAGTIYFKRPIASRDVQFNPIIIVADYETESDIKGKISGGGRGSVEFMNGKLEIGLSAIHESTGQSEGDLLGTDITLKTSDNSELKVELASSDTLNASVAQTGSAYLAEYNYKSAKLDGQVYLREQEGSFGLGPQAGMQTATRKYGVDGSYLLSENIRFNTDLFYEDNLASSATRDAAAVEMAYLTNSYQLSAGLRSAQDTLQTGEKLASDLFLLGASTRVLDNSINLYINSELSIGDETKNSAFPERHILGADYQLTQNANLYAEHEITSGDNQDSDSTRLGVRSTPWKQAQLNTGMEQQSGEYGLRTLATAGLTQGFTISERWSADISFDRAKTLRHPGDLPFNLNVPPASGTLNNDFTAVSLGSTYRAENSTFVNRVESRDSDSENKQGLYLGWFLDKNAGLAYSLKTQWFDTEFTAGNARSQADIRFSIAYRPVESKWIHLNRLDLKSNSIRDITGVADNSRKIINNWKTNYLFNRRNQLALGYGLKYTLNDFDTLELKGYTHLLSGEYRYDIGNNWDLGAHASVLTTGNGHNQGNSYGLSTGWSFVENMWLSIGYNFDGFEDKDFALADYTSEGFYIKLRFKFDQHTFAGADK